MHGQALLTGQCDIPSLRETTILGSGNEPGPENVPYNCPEFDCVRSGGVERDGSCAECVHVCTCVVVSEG